MDTDVYELLPGIRLDVAATVREYCDIDRKAYLYYDSVSPPTPADDLEPADVWIANNLNGRIQLAEFAAIWERIERHRDSIRAGLTAIPRDASLWAAADAVLRDAGRLLDLLCGPRAYGSRITKILHKKRPDLFPIIDARARPLFELVVPTVAGRTWAEYMVEVGRVVGPWIERNAAVLDSSRERRDFLTRLRAYDICLWKHGP